VPTYEYACGSCNAKHEIVQKMTDPTLTDCAECGQPTLRKLFNGVGVVFKGSGFYRTDSRTSGSSSDSGGGEKNASKSSSESTKSEKSSSTGASSSSGSSSSNSSSSSSSSTASKA
jgi:putative FmdB family regulatory protein